jgi:hypothetical protein
LTAVVKRPPQGFLRLAEAGPFPLCKGRILGMAIAILIVGFIIIIKIIIK